MTFNTGQIFAASPDIETNSATEVYSQTATLNGTINGDGGELLSMQGFEYGLTTNYGTDTNQSYTPSYTYSLQFGTDGGSNGQFGDFNFGIDTDSSGNIYVGDNTNYRVQKFDSNGSYLSQFGSFGSGNGQFAGVSGLAIDQSGNIYVSDNQNHRVQKFNSNGSYLSQFGVNGNGDGEFEGPFGIAFDGVGNIYVVDGGNHRVQKFDSNGNYLSQFGVNGSGDGEFENPRGIAIEPNSGDIYVVDTFNHRIQVFNSSGIFQRAFGNNYLYPVGIAISDSGFVYIGDQGHSVIAATDLQGNPLSNFAQSGNGDGQVSLAYNLTIDVNGNVYVLDTYNHRVQKFLPEPASGTFSIGVSGLSCGATYHYRAYATNQSGTSYGSDQTFTTSVCDPTVDTVSATSITTTSVILTGDLVDNGGELNTDQGFQYGKTSSYGNSVTSIVSFDTGIFSKSVGNLICGTTYHYRAFSTNSIGTGYGSDETFTLADCVPELSVSLASKTNNSAILNGSIENNLAPVSTIRGIEYGLTSSYGNTVSENGLFNGGMGYLAEFGSYGNGDGELDYPSGITIDSAGFIYIVDANNNRIQKFDSNGNYLSQFGGYGNGDGQLDYPTDIVIDSSGNIYVSDTNNNRVQKFDSNGNYLSQFGSQGTRTTQFNSPSGITIDSSGNIYIVDSTNNRVKKYNSQGVYQMNFGTSGDGNGEFDYPYDIAIDSSGSIYVSDSGNHRIQKFDSNGVYLSQFGVNGTGNGQLDNPIGLLVDSSDNIYVVDNGNNRIQKFNSNGVYMSKLGEQGNGEGEFYGPSFMVKNTAGDLYLTDSNNGRFVKLSKGGDWSVSVSSLSCDTVYHYRAYATGSNGTSYSTDNTFRTNGCHGFVNVSPISSGGNFYTQNPLVNQALPISNSNSQLASNNQSNTNTQPSNNTNNQQTKFTFTKNLKLGMRDEQVKKLQQFLNSNGYPISKSGIGSLGKETTYFGIATRNALIKYQLANKIKPAVGYFGPVTRGFVNK